MTETVPELLDLDGQVAIVTGGPGQLGSQMCDALAELGAHVVVVSRTAADCEEKARELTDEYQEALAVSADVTDEDAVAAMVETVLDHFGRIDVMVNNAYSGSATSFEEMTADEFRSAFDGAALSTFLCSRAAIDHMRERGSGAIINVSSIYGLVAPDHRIYGDSGLDNPCNYGPAKAGVVQLTRWLAAKFGSDGIRVNCVTPGGFYNEDHEDNPDYEDVFVENYRYRTPLGRMGDETDLKGAVAFLASDASKWVTGENLVVDGGWTIW
jgi:gluconate 5-dehydrogenase